MSKKIFKNKKGFTLIEILAAITILGILTSIAVVSVTKIIENGKKEHYNTAEENMILAGQSYVQQNRNALPKAIGQKQKVSLKTLVEKKYIQPVKDYSDNKCDMEKSYVQVYKYSQSDYSYVAYLECPGYTSEDSLNDHTPDIDASINVDATKSTVTGVVKITGNDKLMSYSYIVYRNDKEVKNTGNISVKGYKEEISLNIPLSEYSPGKIKLVITATNTYGRTKSITKVQEVQDNKDPVCIIKDEDKATATKVWTNEDRKITVGCDDGDGSGCTRDEFSKTFNTTTGVGEITIEDESGNKVNCKVIVNVDKTKPTCTNSGDSTVWTNENRTIYYGCNDVHSGCDPNNSGGSKEFTTTIRAAEIPSYTIKDKAGNTKTCSEREANIYVDKTPPECIVSGGNETWTNESRTIKAECSDFHSGCDTDKIEKVYSSQINTTTAGAVDNNSGGTVKDRAGNVTECPANQTVRIDKTPPTVTNIDNPSGGNATVPGLVLTYYGKDTGGSGIAKWRYTYNTASGWNDYASSEYSPFTSTPYTALRNQLVYISLCDNAGNCSAESSTNIHIVDACSQTTTTWSGTWSACSKTCGGGTQTMTGTKYSTYNGENCGTESKTQTCNPQACKDEINGTRYYNCDSYYITTCESGTCQYTKKNGVASSGTITQSLLTDTIGTNCNKEYCHAIISSSNKEKVTVTYKITGGCTIASYGANSPCSKVSNNSTTFTIKFEEDTESCSVWVNANEPFMVTPGATLKYHVGWITIRCSANKFCTTSCGDGGVCVVDNN